MYKWYDSLAEPTRFFVFFIPALILIAGINAPSMIVCGISWILLVTMLVTRAIYIHNGRKGGQ